MNKPTIARCADCGQLTDGECLSYQSTDGEHVTWNCGCVSGIDSQGMIVDFDPVNRLLNEERGYRPNRFAPTPEDLLAGCGLLMLLIAGVAIGQEVMR